MTSIYLGLALLVLIRGMSARLDFSYGRARSVFDQLLLRSCWFAIGLLLVLATALRIGVSAASTTEDLSLIVFLIGCTILLELASLVIYRARLETTPFGGRLVCRNEYLGELKLDRENTELIFTIRAGPDGFSTHTNLGPGSRGRAKTPGWLVNQVVVRLRGRALMKYLVVCEARSERRANDIAARLASALGVPKLGDPGWREAVQASANEDLASSSDEPNELMALVLKLLDGRAPPALDALLAIAAPSPESLNDEPDGATETLKANAEAPQTKETTEVEAQDPSETEEPSDAQRANPSFEEPEAVLAELQAQSDHDGRD